MTQRQQPIYSPYRARCTPAEHWSDFVPAPVSNSPVLVVRFLVWPLADILHLDSFPISLGVQRPRHVIALHQSVNLIVEQSF